MRRRNTSCATSSSSEAGIAPLPTRNLRNGSRHWRNQWARRFLLSRLLIVAWDTTGQGAGGKTVSDEFLVPPGSSRTGTVVGVPVALLVGQHDPSERRGFLTGCTRPIGVSFRGFMAKRYGAGPLEPEDVVQAAFAQVAALSAAGERAMNR